MAYEKDQNDFSLPVNNNTNRSGTNLLPKFFRTDFNKKFISSTIDQMIKPGVVEKINAFAGRRYAKPATASDAYLKDVSISRENYQFEPATLYKDELDNVEFYKDYNDYVNQIKNFKGSVSNHSLMNNQEFYSYDPHIDWDKFANFREYYWLPLGPTPIDVFGQQREVVSTYTVTIADEVDNVAFVLTPNGFTKNPTIKLYKGQVYRFEVNSPGHPFALAISRFFQDSDPSLGIDPSITNNLYTKGVKIFEPNEEGVLVETDSRFVEVGVLEFTVPEDVPTTLFYIDKNEINTSGIINTYEINENTAIDIDADIIGKKTYKTRTGIDFSNGMKVKFQGLVTPEIYANGYWYVEGVGSAIRLVAEQSLEVPAIFTSSVDVPFDAYAFDQYPFEDATSFAGTKDYIVVNRSSADRNPWSRYNRWFHRDVIRVSAEANGQEMNLDQSARAKRPIIEFNAGLKLFNHGTKAKTNVDLVDTFTRDVFSTIEGSLGYNVDGVDLVDGMRVLFTADTDILVNGRIYQVKYITHNGRRQITLLTVEDTEPLQGNTVLILSGTAFRGKMFHYDVDSWKLAQEKLTVNQAPLFDLFDKDSNNFADEIVYPSSSFRGNKVFSYEIGSGSADEELGFSVKYRSIANVGDIVFTNNLTSESFTYQNALRENLTKNTDLGFLKLYDFRGETFSYVNSWKKSNKNSVQAVVRIYEYNPAKTFAIDVYENSALLNDLIVKVYVNGIKKYLGVDYNLTDNNNQKIVTYLSPLTKDDLITVKTWSSAAKTTNGFYEVPSNLEKNPLNQNINTFTLGELTDHVSSITEWHPDFKGTFPGTGNLRDLSETSQYGKRFLQHTGPINLALYHITDKEANLVKAIKFARKEYAKFKRQFIDESGKTGFDGSIKEHVDLILKTITKDKTPSMPFYFSDMLGFGAAIKTQHTIEYSGPAYFALSNSFNLTSLSVKAVSVYHNNVYLLHGRDYTFTDSFVYVTVDLQDGDIVEVIEYDSTNGSYIPPTPTKLGLYPKYHPMIFVDNTYNVPTKVIQGHDGSLIKAFNDYRDDLILELEYRIYNNIKCDYDSSINDIYDFVPSYDRDTKYLKKDIDQAMLADFSQWLEISGSPDYSVHDFFDRQNSFTFNYSFMTDKAGNKLEGYWRNIYKKYYDTDRPHTHPWEMLGFTIKPTWWESVYGPAPYTKDNLILWEDLRDGVVREPNKSLIRNPKYFRPDLLSYIPTDEYGRLQSPLESGLAQNFNQLNISGAFDFGDQAPVETAWRRSSEFPFSLLLARVLLQPAKTIGLGFDCSRIERDLAGNIVYKETEKRLSLDSIVFPSISTNETLTLTSGLVNYVSNYMVSKTTTNYTDYKNKLTNLTNQLALKIAGFADKAKLKLVLDSRSPLNKSSVFVPDENYQIFLNTSSAIDVVTFSGIIIEKTADGYILTGYDKEDPSFVYNKAIETASDPAITVGAISETFVSWAPEKEYPIGTVVFYENRYYRSIITHTSSNTFEGSKFAALAELPVVGGITAKLRKRFEVEESQLPYGSILDTVQDVVDFMLGYEYNLINKGFEFGFFNRETETLENIQLCIKEFMFWVTQNWDIGTILTLSPIANQVKFARDYAIVDDIYDSFYDYNLIAGNGQRINKEFSNVFREDPNEFGVKPVGTDEGIFLVKLPLIQIEHVVLVDNETVFNDVIYDTEPGYRQERIKVVGYRTDEWSGGLNIPGFIYDDAKVKIWNTWTDYAIGDVVKYKEFYYAANQKHTSTEFFDANNWNILNERPIPELLPNWDYKVNQFTDFYDLDTDNFDTEQQRLGQHLIGYQSREYLANIITDSVSQYKFYQGFIQDKGTKNALTKLFDALSSADVDSLEFYEEWAIRLGQYGAIDNIVEVEFEINEQDYKLEPQLFQLVNSVDSTRTDLVYQIPSYSVYVKPDTYSTNLFAELNNNDVYTKNAGYVRNQDVTFLASNYEQLLELDINDIRAGDFVWINDDNQDWNVVRVIATDYQIESISDFITDESTIDFDELDPTTGFTIYFDRPVDFAIDEIIGIKSNLEDINGFFKIKRIFGNEVVVLSDITINLDEYTDSSVRTIFRFVDRRFDSVNDVNENITNIRENFNDRIWIDNIDGKWAVYENENIFSLKQEIENPSVDADLFGTGFAVNSSNSLLVVSSPAAADPKFRIYKRSSEIFDWSLLNEIEVNTSAFDSVDSLGYSVAISDDGNVIALGAPGANIKTNYVGEYIPSTSYDTGDIVSDRGAFWRAKVATNTDSTVLSLSSEDWEPVYLLEAEESGTSLTGNVGVVILYERNASTNQYELKHYILSPELTTEERFGYTLEIRKVLDGYYKIFVGAPGQDNVDQGRIYFLDNNDGYWSYSRDRLYRDEYDPAAYYTTDDIVFYNGKLYQALTNLTPITTVLPTNTASWKEIEPVEYTGYIPHAAYSLTVDGEESIYTDGKNVGKKFDVNKHGDVLIMSAKADYETLAQDVSILTERIGIYRNLNNRWVFSQKIDAEDSADDFGFRFAINDNGDKIAIGSPLDDQQGINAGAVKVFVQQTVTEPQFVLQQTLYSPFNEPNESFGNGLDFSKNKLVVTGKNTDRRLFTSFDRFSEVLPTVVTTNSSGQEVLSNYVLDPMSFENETYTTFDGNSTQFINVTKDAGRLALFQEIGNSFIFAEDINYNRNTSFNDLTNIKFVDNHIYVGLPKLDLAATLDSSLESQYIDNSNQVGIVADIAAVKNKDSWTVTTAQDGKIDVEQINRCFLYSKDKNDIIANLDIIDVRQGKIAGIAEQELSFKTFYDPAIYSVNEPSDSGVIESVIVDDVANWTDAYVGKLWWDLSTVSWYDPYQGTIQYRAANWNQPTFNASVDVYEWVSTDLLPSQWAELADTNDGFAQGISGVPLYGNNIYSTKSIYDSSSNTFRLKYYYWVRNKRIVPQSVTRRISAFDVAALIENPAEQGYRFVAFLDTDKFAIYNCKNLIEGNNTILHFSFVNDKNLQNNIHSEYQLLTEGLDTSVVNSEIEQKWFDSLVGYDLNNNRVPDTDLSVKQRYGILNSPRQGMFVNRIEAVKQFVERTNSVLIKNQIVDNYRLDNLLSIDEEPALVVGKYDTTVDTVSELRFIGVAKSSQAILRPVVQNGRITSVVVVNSGRGYKVAPAIKINDNSGSGAILQAEINNLGQITKVNVRKQGKNYSANTSIFVRPFSVLVKSDEELGGRWAIYSWNRSAQVWNRDENQSFDTTRYWTYADWYADGYSAQSNVNQVISQSYELFALSNNIGDIVKIETVGAGGWLLLEKIDDQLTEDYTINYKTIGRQNGTIQLSTRLYDYANLLSGYDANIYDSSFYDREPIYELRNILTALRDDIFIGDLAAEYNKLFFASVRYALSEQSNVDWVFKTSFIRAKHNLGDLRQKVTFQNDNLENYEDYVMEIKPYSAKIREYISNYNHIEPTNSLTTDFDVPPSYNQETKNIETIPAKYFDGEVVDVVNKYLEYPFRSWVDNNGYDVVRINIADGGEKYKETPVVTVVGNKGTTAKAYLSKGRVSHIEVVNKGGKYYTAPEVIIEGTVDTGGRAARAVAILGNSVVRNAHMILKFDRVSGNYFITDINVTETFTGTGGKEKFYLKWPIDLKIGSWNITVDNSLQLRSQVTVNNELDVTKGYDRNIGYIEFTEAPALGSLITVTYKKNISMLDAADRINFFYNPTSGMAGKDLTQLMDGVEYSGVKYDSYGFGTNQGFDIGGFGSLPFDTFDNRYEDEIFVLDGSTNTFDLSKPLENGVEYNFYLNGVRLDDPNYGTMSTVLNPNAKMQTIIGDGVTDRIIIDETTIVTVDGDRVIIRKSTSDGSFTPADTTYDTALSGGNFAYTTATGVAAEDVVIDGDGFVTPTTSKGPEEQVPGQLYDTLDIKVYHRASDGVGIIQVANYILDGETSVFKLPGLPQSNNGIIVKLDNIILDSSAYTINWNEQTVEFEDSSSSIGSTLSITTVGTNGAELIDTGVFTYDGSTSSIVTAATWDDELSAFVTVNGVVQQPLINYNLIQTTNDETYPNRAKIVFEPGVLVSETDYVQWTIYASSIKTYSQIIIDKTFESDGVKNYHKFDGNENPIPFNNQFISHNILVKVDNRILSPGYSIYYTATDLRDYDIEAWQFADTTTISEAEVFVFADNVQLAKDEYSFDPVNARVRILRNDIAEAGSKLKIHVIKNADYYFVDTKLDIENLDGSDLDLSSIVNVGEEIKLSSIADSTVYFANVKSVDNNSIVVETFRPDLRAAFIADDEFEISVADSDSTVLRIIDVTYPISDSITFAVAPSSGQEVEIYQFSNHDINNFQRITYDVISTSILAEGTTDYIKRNLLTRGIIYLTGPVTASQYAWVAKNGELLTPNIDYIVLDSLDAVQLKEIPLESDRIDIIQFGTDPVTPKFGYRIFKDMLNRTHYKRLNQANSYTLAQPLNYYDARIVLHDATGIFTPNRERNIPGVIFIEGERIEFFEVRNNTLLQLRRGTLGTGIKEVYAENTRAYGQGPEESIDYADRLLVQTITADGSTSATEYTLDYVPQSVDEIEVFVAGRRLRKTPLTIFNPTIALDSNEGNIILPQEFTIDNGNIFFTVAPSAGTEIKIVRKIGQVWNEPGKSLANTNNQIARFLRKATIQLPK